MLYLDIPNVEREAIGAKGSTRARVEVLGDERAMIGMIGMSDQINHRITNGINNDGRNDKPIR
jgi:hypothetical protein